jgi:hypothetical protein
LGFEKFKVESSRVQSSRVQSSRLGSSKFKSGKWRVESWKVQSSRGSKLGSHIQRLRSAPSVRHSHFFIRHSKRIKTGKSKAGKFKGLKSSKPKHNAAPSAH